MSEPRPTYDWDHARVGDVAEPVSVVLTAELFERYWKAIGKTAASQPAGIPIVMIRAYAPLRRRELVAHNGADYPKHPTPAVKWHARVFRDLQVGDALTSVTKVADKYEKNGRRYLQWEVEARRGDEIVARFGYVNLWEATRPEDRQR